MQVSVRSILTGLGILSSIAGLGSFHVAAREQEPQAKPRELRIMSYNIKHGQTNASCTQPPRIPGHFDIDHGWSLIAVPVGP